MDGKTDRQTDRQTDIIKYCRFASAMVARNKVKEIKMSLKRDLKKFTSKLCEKI